MLRRWKVVVSNLPKQIVKMMNSSRHHEYYLRVLLCFQKMEEEKVDFHKVVLFPILSNANSSNKHS